MTAAQLDLVIYDPTEPRIMPQFPAAFFTINRAEGTRLRQSVYPLRQLAELLPLAAGQSDVYMSQAVFDAPRRRVVNVSAITHAAVDLDCYNDPAIKLMHAPAIVSALIDHCAGAGIPPPSIIISSGRGYYIKWFWTAPIPRAAAGRATELNRRLVRALAAFRADPACVDMARVLRICGTVNSKSGRPVEIVHLAGTQDAPLTYDFDAFADALLPAVAEPPPSAAAARRELVMVPRGRFTYATWAWAILEDIRTLARLHYPDGIVTEGERNLYGHLAAVQLARVVPSSVLWRETDAMCRVFLPAEFVGGELRQKTSTLLARAAGAEVVAFSGRSSPIYGYSKTRMMDLLRVTPDDERHMAALIGAGEKRRRHEEARRDRRRAAGVVARAEYEALAAARRSTVARLRGLGWTWRAIGAELGIAESEARRLAV